MKLHKLDFLKSKSKSIKTAANLDNVIPKFINKLEKQNHTRTYFDNKILSHLLNMEKSQIDYCSIYENMQNSKEKRFIEYNDRINFTKNLKNFQLYHEFPILLSQGTHSLVKWKDIPIFKTVFDLNIYMELINNVKPNYIIELGSGLGGSTLWLADISKSLGLQTEVISLDIVKPSLTHSNIEFIKQDLNDLEGLKNCFDWYKLKGSKILINDAAVNLHNILNFFDNILEKNDYLIIEDSLPVVKNISQFMNENKKYLVDQYYLDFFGTNITSCVNSIFKKTNG